MAGYPDEYNAGHGWVSDGVKKDRYYSSYFIEVLYRNEYQSPDSFPSLENQNRVYDGGHTLYFHMNWGWYNAQCNGWYLDNNISTSNGDFSYNRYDIFSRTN